MTGTYTIQELSSTIVLLKAMESALEMINLVTFVSTQLNAIQTIYLFIANTSNIYIAPFSTAILWYLIKG